MYYSNKLESLKDIFGSNDVRLEPDRLVVNGRGYPVVDDVIILLDPGQYPESLKGQGGPSESPSHFAEDIQFTFGEEWKEFSEILEEHKRDFLRYFDLVDVSGFSRFRLCDLGCGSGRWSHFLKDKCRELVLVDFSEAIFSARRNLKNAGNALFFMGDLKRLPFREKFADFLYCLGVLHHLPTNALAEVRALKKYAPTLLIYLYYALDNRPIYFRGLLAVVTGLRRLVSRIRNPFFRLSFSWLTVVLVYLPLVCLGWILKPVGLAPFVPLYEGYHGKSLQGIRQDVYDRFFTRIEQRFSRKQILALKDTFNKVVVSDHLPYWHFLCQE
ncbi:MAG: class I SAM-dependent methyltransferase [Blastocatellia bacterium]|nr:class I SAM-dependent methyltransferase [Blastocatellia bacterium]